jgi:phytoene synthase
MTDIGRPMRENYQHCESLVREHDRDRWLASLFAPADRRPHLHALYAFDRELSLVPHRVHEALAGEMRLQWWRDALAGEARGDAAAHPVAAALIDTVARCRLSTAPLDALIDARAHELYEEPFATIEACAAYGEQTASAIIALAARILDRDAAVAEVAVPAGIAATLVDLMQSPAHRETKIAITPADLIARTRAELDRVRRHWHVVSPAAMPAFLPLAVVSAELARASRGADAIKPVRLAPWRRQWLLWRAARRGSI